MSDEERLQLLIQLYTKPASNYRSPGAAALGCQRMRAVGYLRNSVGKLEVNTSIPRQLEEYLEYCARMNLIPSCVFADPDTSGVTVLERAGMMRMLLHVRAGFVDVITTEAPDRIGRAMSAIGMTWDTIRRHNIPLINLQDGTPLTEHTILLHGFMAANEHAKIKARTSDGARRKARDSNEITKRLAYGHYREHPGGPVKIHPVQSRIKLEACVGYEAGLTTGQLAAINNKKWKAGDKDYMPPHQPNRNYGGKELIWKHNHFITGSKWMSGLLKNAQCIGNFYHGVSRSERDPLSGKVTLSFPDDPVKPVQRPELAYVPIELWARVKKRRLTEKEAGVLRREEEKSHRPPASADTQVPGSAGKRRLLSGIIKCGCCGETYTFRSWRGETVMMCRGMVTRRCTKQLLINFEMLQKKLVDAFEREITSRGALGIAAEVRQKEFASILEEIRNSRVALEDRLKVLRDDLQDIRTNIRNARAKQAKNVFEEEQIDIEQEMKEIEDKLDAITAEPLPDPIRSDETLRARGLLHRLRDPNIGFSDDLDDIWIVQRFRNVVRGLVKPNAYDYGAEIQAELDFAKFFHSIAIASPIGPVKCSFVISVPPRASRHRHVPKSQINMSMLKNWEEYPMSDAIWTDITKLIEPYKELPRMRKHFQIFLVSLRAGSGPTSRHFACRVQRFTRRITVGVRKHGLWSKFERILREHKELWIDTVDPGYIAYLNGLGGDSKAEWKITHLDP